MPDPDYFHGVSHRVLAEPWLVKITPVDHRLGRRSGDRGRGTLGHCGRDCGAMGHDCRDRDALGRGWCVRRTPDDGDLLGQMFQISVDFEKLPVQRVAHRGKIRLNREHDHILHVHEHEERQHGRVEPVFVHGPQPDHVEWQDSGRAQRGDQQKERAGLPAFCVRRRSVHLVRACILLEHRHGGEVLAQQREQGRETRHGQRTWVDALQRGERDFRTTAAVVQRAQDRWRHDESVRAHRQHRDPAQHGRRFDDRLRKNYHATDARSPGVTDVTRRDIYLCFVYKFYLNE